MTADCVFCQIVAGKTDGKIIYQDDEITAFWDRIPMTPVHVLIVPNRHIESVNQVNEQDACLLGKMLVLAKQIAAEQGVGESGYRLVINTGPNAGQSIFHLHLHLIGGLRMGIKLN